MWSPAPIVVAAQVEFQREVGLSLLPGPLLNGDMLAAVVGVDPVDVPVARWTSPGLVESG
jgi:hypothetical protein